MRYTDDEVSTVTAAMEKYRGGEDGETGAALVVVGLSAERAAKEARIRDDMLRVAHRAGASIRQLAGVSGLGRKTVTAIVVPVPLGTDVAQPTVRDIGRRGPGSDPDHEAKQLVVGTGIDPVTSRFSGARSTN